MTENDENNEDTTTLENAGRRKAVKTIVGGVTAVAAYNLLPAKWGTPIIESVFLPAHAATSGTSLNDPCEVTWVSGYQDSNTVVVKVNGYVTPPTGGLATTIVATGNPDATATVNTTTATDGTFTGTLTLTTATGLSTVGVVTTVTGADGSARCSVDIPQRNSGPTILLNDDLVLGINARGCGTCGAPDKYFVVTVRGSVSPATEDISVDITIVVDQTNTGCPASTSQSPRTVTTRANGFYSTEFRFNGDAGDTILTATATSSSAGVGGTATKTFDANYMTCYSET